MSDALSIVVHNREQAHDAITRGYALSKALLADGRRVHIAVGEDEEPKTVKQLRFFHGPVLEQISEQAVVEGQRFVKEVWKQHLKNLLLPDKFDMVRGLVLDTSTGKFRLAKRATPRKREKSLSSLSVKQMSEFIDKTLAYAATEWGVQFDLDPLDREAVRYYPPARKAKQAEEVEA